MKRIAVFPGSFDPITIGHQRIVERARPLFEKIVVAVGHNNKKKSLYTLEQRIEWLEAVFANDDQIEIEQYENLTAHYCKLIGANYLLRGLRSAADFEYEKTISQLNHVIGDGVETVFFISEPEYTHISSTIVREIIRGNGDASPFLPKAIKL